MERHNKLTIEYLIPAEQLNHSRELSDAFVLENMTLALAGQLATTIPVSIELVKPCLGHGYSDEIHRLSIFVFSEEEMVKHNEDILRSSLLTIAVDRALLNLPEVPCN